MTSIVLNLCRHGVRTPLVEHYLQTALDMGRQVVVVHNRGLEIYRRRGHLTVIETMPGAKGAASR